MVSGMMVAMDTVSSDAMKSAPALGVAARKVTDTAAATITTMNDLDRTRIR